MWCAKTITSKLIKPFGDNNHTQSPSTPVGAVWTGLRSVFGEINFPRRDANNENAGKSRRKWLKLGRFWKKITLGKMESVERVCEKCKVLGNKEYVEKLPGFVRIAT